MTFSGNYDSFSHHACIFALVVVSSMKDNCICLLPMKYWFSWSVSLQLCSLHLHKEVTTQCNESNCSHSGILNINRYRPGLKQYLSLTYFFKPVVAMKKKYTYIYTICKSMLMTNANFIQVLIYIKSKQNKNHIVILHCIQSIESEHSKDTPGPGKLVCSLITWGKNKNEYWKHRCKMYC